MNFTVEEMGNAKEFFLRHGESGFCIQALVVAIALLRYLLYSAADTFFEFADGISNLRFVAVVLLRQNANGVLR